jgi:prolipoprotein diacylglyceryl transferase
MKATTLEHFIWNADPVLLHMGFLQLRWYGLFFVSSFFLGLWFMQWIFNREGKDPSVLDNFLIYLIIGAVVGSRLMHCLAYEPDFYLSHPIEILKIWKGGLASHGGLLGSIVAVYLFSRRYHINLIWLLSRTAIAGTITASFVRIGNFFNSEILGLPTNKPWAVIFERVDMVPRHPVQLYEALSYALLFLLMLTVYKRLKPDFATKILPGIFLTVMFIVRFLLEYTKTRQADYTTALPFTTGQMLSIPFIILGIGWIIWALQNKEKTT